MTDIEKIQLMAKLIVELNKIGKENKDLLLTNFRAVNFLEEYINILDNKIHNGQ